MNAQQLFDRIRNLGAASREAYLAEFGDDGIATRTLGDWDDAAWSTDWQIATNELEVGEDERDELYAESLQIWRQAFFA